ncbi:MAG: hypothetical protein K6V97_00950 [Actinomycetia bacterium]|nr:hypothetical protein [Actinomycetes bacterium]
MSDQTARGGGLRRALGYAAAAVLAAFAVVGALGLEIVQDNPFQPGVARPAYPVRGVVAPPVVLTDQDGQTVDAERWRGHVVVLGFMAAGAGQSVRPARVLAAARRDLGPAARDVRWALVNTNPLATGTAAVRATARRARLDPDVRFLTGAAPVLLAVWQAYHVDVAPAGGRLVYTAPVYVIDRSGREWDAMLVNLGPAGAADVAAEGRAVAAMVRAAARGS